MADFNILRGSQSSYDSLYIKYSDTLYLCIDTGNLYCGNVQITDTNLVRSIIVGNTTTGEPGTNASVTNRGTESNLILDFTIPRGESANQPFKGWWTSFGALKSAMSATQGDYAYVKDGNNNSAIIYIYSESASSDNFWADSGNYVDTSNVNTFASGEPLNEIEILSEPTIGSGSITNSGGEFEFIRKEDSLLYEKIQGSYRLLDVQQKYLSSQGSWNDGNYSVLVDVSGCRGKHITRLLGTGEQYAFLSESNSESATFAQGCSRVDSVVNDTLVPCDAKYLYQYLGNSYSYVLPSYYVDGNNVGWIDSLSAIPYRSRLIYANIFDSSNSLVTLSDALSVIPEKHRFGNSLLVFRDTKTYVHIYYYHSFYTTNEIWNNTNNWSEIKDSKWITSASETITDVTLNGRLGATFTKGFVLANGSYYENGTGFLIKASQGDEMYIKAPSSIPSFYAFLGNYEVPYAVIGQRNEVSSNSEETVTIPEGCVAVWVAKTISGSGYDYTPSEFTLNGEHLLIDKINNFHIIYANEFIRGGLVDKLSDVLSAIPSDFRKELSVLNWRNKYGNSFISFYVSQSLTDENWNNTDYWKTIITDKDLYEHKDYPIVFNKDTNSYIAFMKNKIVLDSDGDSLEMDITCGCSSLQPNGYGLAVGGHSSGIAIGACFTSFAVRADDGTWIISLNDFTGSNTINRYRYKIKILYQSSNILIYLDDVLVKTYSGQKTITITGLGNAGAYGNWNGTLHSIKYNNNRYDLWQSSFYGFSSNLDCSQTMAKKTNSVLTVYRKYKDNLYISLPVRHVTRAFTEGQYPSYYDNWKLSLPALCYFNGSSMEELTTLFRDGEAETAIEVPRGDVENGGLVYVSGDAHGFENIETELFNNETIRKISFVVDNKNIEEGASFELKPTRLVEIKQFSKVVQAYTNSNPFADIVKEWSFGEKIQISTSVKFTRDIQARFIMQGMFCVYRHISGNSSFNYLTKRAVKGNCPYRIYNVEDQWESDAANDSLKQFDNECSKIIQYGDEISKTEKQTLGFSMSIENDNREEDAGMTIGTNGSNYNKIYFCTHKTQETVRNGKEYHATQTWSFL